MSSGEQTPVTSTTTTAAPEVAAQAKPDGNTQNAKAQPPQQQPAEVKNPGAAFAALDRREKAIKAREAELRAIEERANQTLVQAKEFEGLSVDQILERVAKARNMKPEDLIKAHIAKVTGAPTADKLIEESKDPAVKALAEEIKMLRADNKDLKDKLETKDKSEQEAQQRANVAAVKTECLASATEAWKDESDFPFFFTDKTELADAVFRYCADRVNKYVQENKVQPDEDQIIELIKAAPQLMIDDMLKSPRGQRIASLKQPKLAEETKESKPRLSPNRVAVVPKPDEKPTVRTKNSAEERRANASRLLPDNVRFPGL